ncbi:polysaccharide deacetylase family protein [Azorhizobium doebereinerae]|uniref:polysaccharide deacetylase family protein n=1 Tax=Azorhizobium doebereinerae TaxID=281091 RepID=UPI000423904F|nr:polysaccharide deacetylase family protein [Azorhizobium doebereinerae]
MSAFATTAALGLGFAFSQMLPLWPAPVATTSAAQTPVVRVTDTPPPVAVATPAPVAAPAFAAPAFPSLTQDTAMTPPASTPPRGPAAYRSANVDGPYIALTFDDGPNPETTPKLLKMLEARHIKATFFMLGSNAAANPDVVRSVAAAGHEIGNHSWNHPQLTKISEAAADKQIEDTSAAIQATTGVKPTNLRPPYGSMTPALQRHIEQKYGMNLIFWSVDPLDWKVRDAQNINDQIMKQVRPGAIVLAHDIHATTVAAMPRVLDNLIAKGYKFVTVSELIAMDKPAAPKVAAATVTPPPPRKKPRPTQPGMSMPRPTPVNTPAQPIVPPRPVATTGTSSF